MKKILIVEDSAQFRHLLVDLLDGYCDKVYECTDGMDVMRAYKKYKPDCVVMDIQMNEMDGFDATRRLKVIHPEARVVLMSQYNDPEIQQEAKMVGAERSVPKENILELRTIFSKKIKSVA